ncbi:MAG: hypothetical protein ACR2K3_14410 [Nocardioides sp.]
MKLIPLVMALGASAVGGAAHAATLPATVSSAPNKTAGFDAPVRAVVYHAGVVYVGGDFTHAVQNGHRIARNHVAAINPATGQLLPWNPNADGSVDALAVTDSYVYLGGSFTRVGGAAHSRLARVSTSAGTVDPGFKGNTNRTVKALAVNGAALYVGGSFTKVSGRAVSDLVALSSTTGALNSTWRATANGVVRSLAVANGWVYAGGDFTSMDGSARGGYLASLDPTSGALQSDYTSSVGYRVNNVAATSTTIYAAADGVGGHLRAVNLNGSSRWTVTSDGGFQAVAVLGDVVYAGGHFDNICSTARFTGAPAVCRDGSILRRKLIAVSTGGTLLPWAPQANSALGTYSLSADPATGRVAAGGEWTTFHSGSISQPRFALFS